MVAQCLFIGRELPASGALQSALQPLGGHLTTAGSIDAAASTKSRFDIVLVDVHPAIHWAPDIFERARDAWDAIVVALMPQSEALERVLVFEFGADAVLERPFSEREAVALFGALLRRHRAIRERRHAPAPPAPKRSTWRLDATGRRITLSGGAFVALSTVESLVVAALIERPGHVRSRADLLIASGLSRRGHHLNVVDLAISRLRRKLEEAGLSQRCIQTVRGKGYMLRDDVDAASC